MHAANREKIIKVAQKYVSQGKIENAIKEYEKLLKINSNDPVLSNTIGDLNLRLKKVQTAISFFKKSAQHFINEGFHSKAIAVYKKITRADPNNLENAETLADLFVKEGVLPEAKKIYARLGQKYLQGNNFEKAYDVFKKLSDISEEDPQTHLKFAELSIKFDKLEDAREAYLKAALILSKHSQYQKAIDAIKMALEIDPLNTGTIKVLFKTSLEIKEFNYLEKVIKNALENIPDDINMKEMLGQCYMFQHKFREAALLFEDVLKNDRDKYLIFYDLAQSAAMVGDFDNAVDAISRIMDIMLEKKGNQKLQNLLKSILEEDPAHIGALKKLAEFYLKISDNFNYVETMSKLADVAMSQRNYNLVLETCEKLFDIDPSNEKCRSYHKEAFEKLYPNETYVPPNKFSNGTRENEEPLFTYDTTELASGDAFKAKSSADEQIEIDILLSYGLKDKAKNKLQEHIKKRPDDVIFREKLKEIYLDEGNLKKAADICFELVNIYTLKGEHEKAAELLEEGKGLDPERSDIALPTGALSEEITFPEEIDTSTTGFDILEIQDEGIDLSDDLSDILVGDDQKGEIEKQIKDSTQPPLKADIPTGPTLLDDEINYKLEQTLTSIGGLDIKAPIILEDTHLEEAETNEKESSESLKELTESQIEESISKNNDKPSIKELQATLQEIDFYIKLGFNDNAKEELLKLKDSYPNHPEIISRLRSLGREETPKKKPKKKDFVIQTQIEIQQLEKEESLAKKEKSAEPPPINEISPDEVNIDLFNNIHANDLKGETEEDLSSYQMKKNIPDIEKTSLKQTKNENPFENLSEEEIFKESLLFNEEKTSTNLSRDGLFVSNETEENTEQQDDQNLTAMHNIFADIVEEANKVMISNLTEDEGDFKTHYDLGIAYEEMGLLDDAIGELQKAFSLIKDQASSAEFVNVCHMLSICFSKKGLYKSAIKWGERGLNSPGHQPHEYMVLKYDLAQAYEQLGNFEKALEYYTEVYEENINYQDVGKKISELRKKTGK